MKTTLVSILLLATFSCKHEIVEPLVYSRDGIVTFSGEPSSDGCGWNLETYQGETFHPVNLAEDFMEDSLVVGMTLKPIDESFLCSFNVRIPKVEILNIEKI